MAILQTAGSIKFVPDVRDDVAKLSMNLTIVLSDSSVHRKVIWSLASFSRKLIASFQPIFDSLVDRWVMPGPKVSRSAAIVFDGFVHFCTKSVYGYCCGLFTSTLPVDQSLVYVIQPFPLDYVFAPLEIGPSLCHSNTSSIQLAWPVQFEMCSAPGLSTSRHLRYGLSQP